MITFKQYLRESEDNPTDDELKAEADAENDDWLKNSKIKAILLKDCAPFMKVCKRSGFMYRGIKNIDEEDPILIDGMDEIPLFKKTVRTDRRPLNSSNEAQVMYDKWFEKKFGYKVRAESMFCFPEDEKDGAKQYGPVCLVFPIGDFEYVWSPKVVDLQIYTEDKIGGYGDEADIIAMLDKAGYKNTGLGSALGKGSEIMVKCKSYYAIPADFVHDIHELVM